MRALAIAVALLVPSAALAKTIESGDPEIPAARGAIVGIKGPLVELRGLRDGRIGLSSSPLSGGVLEALTDGGRELGGAILIGLGLGVPSALLLPGRPGP